ncbi:MAG: ABC transporter permease, partial [Candidatus Firestonebacteria bacterium]|nr:ABC transporter permease [Candidatus Firestonebacteria bacterium]
MSRFPLWSKFSQKRLAILGACLVGSLILLCLGAPLLTTHLPDAQDLSLRLRPPSFSHWLGTDEFGRDVWTRMLYGGRISLSVGLVAVGISLTIGIFLGALAGYFGGWVDQLIMRTVDIVLCIPTLFLILMLVVFIGPNLLNIMVIIGLTSWTDLSRLVRAEFLSLKNREYVLAARALGAKNLRIIFKHILPNALAPVFVSATFGVAGAILLESGLSFLGLGVQPPTPSWGNILSAGKDYLTQGWWLTLFPGLAIFITVLGYNLLGDGLRDILD